MEESGISYNGRVPKFQIQNKELTLCQMRVVSLLMHGLYRRQIGGYLGISFHTVNSHCSRIYSHIEINDSRLVLVWALQNGFDLKGNYKNIYLFKGYEHLPWQRPNATDLN